MGGLKRGPFPFKPAKPDTYKPTPIPPNVITTREEIEEALYGPRKPKKPRDKSQK